MNATEQGEREDRRGRAIAKYTAAAAVLFVSAVLTCSLYKSYKDMKSAEAELQGINPQERAIIQQYDVNGDRHLSPSELQNLAKDYEFKKKQ